MDYERIYEYRFKDINPNLRLTVWTEIAKFIHKEMGYPPKILDPAAGFCEFIHSITAKEKWIVDKYLPINLKVEENIKIIKEDILKVTLPENYFNGVFVSNLLEHFNNHTEINDFLKKMSKALTTNGTIAILGPNFKYCYKLYFDCADHNLCLTHVSICEHLYSVGFNIKKIIPKFIPFSFRQKLPRSKLITKTYLNFPFLWKLFGKQFLIIATK